MYVSHDHKIIFLALAKNASRTVSKFLMEKTNAKKVEKHHSILKLEKVEDYRVFAVVRNPYARLVSRWWNYSRHNEDEIAKDFVVYMKRLEPATDVETYKNYLFPMRQSDIINHSQQFFCNAITVIKLENINEEWNKLKMPAEASAFPPKRRSLKKQHYGKWQDYYTKPWLQDKAFKTYYEDFRQFGYSSQINH